ncbi:MAG: acyl-coenzyme thioesterase 13, partial [Pseudonocardiales bacterium]|nr:acyl-coenzyme thioesterase 13 [Pseudonocardiales bacterium]
VNVEQLRAALKDRPENGWQVPGLDPVLVDGGHVVVRVEVTLEHVNAAKTLHGGAAATLVDVVGTLAILNEDTHHRPGVSTDLNVSWFAPVALGDTAIVDGQVLKIGRSLAFVTVDIRRGSDDTLCVQGRMTKALGSPPG